MKPVEFKEQNVVFAANQPEYLPLPAYRSADGRVTSCWECSFLERLLIMLTGKVYLQLLTFNKPLQPSLISVDKPKEWKIK